MIDPKWINASGFVTIQPNAADIPGEGNGFLVTGLAVACNQYRPDTNIVFAVFFNTCVRSLTMPPIYRSPYKKNPGDETKIDDYWGAMVLAKYYNPAWAKSALEYGEEMDWIFNCINPEDTDLNFRFDRFPAFIPCLRLSAGQSLSLFENIALSLTILWDAFHISEADKNMQAYCRIMLARKTMLGPLFESLWVRNIRKRYGTIGKSWESYFGTGHPLNDFN